MKPDVRYSDELFAEICSRIIEGRSLRSICSDDDMPAAKTVFMWLADREELREQYARAKQVQAERFADEIMEIADTATDAQLGRLRVDARKWIASKMLPKVYGDKMDVTSGGAPLANITIVPKGENPD